jgi:hypothetical protein
MLNEGLELTDINGLKRVLITIKTIEELFSALKSLDTLHFACWSIHDLMAITKIKNTEAGWLLQYQLYFFVFEQRILACDALRYLYHFRPFTNFDR